MSATTPLRVLHVIASLAAEHGGTTSSVLEMIDGLRAQGVACDIATSDDAGLGKRLSAHAAERDIAGRHYFAKKTQFYLYTPALAKWVLIHAKRFDVVHIHGLFSYVNGAAARACRQAGVPYVVTAHGMASTYGLAQKPRLKTLSLALIERPLLKNAALIHMTSTDEQRQFEKLDLPVTIRRIPLAVTPVPAGDPARFFAKHPELKGKKIAIFVGRLHHVKNIEAILDALALDSLKEVHLVICGDGPDAYRDTLKERARALGVSYRAHWLGFVFGPEKEDAMAAADFCVNPSWVESFGMSAIEAVSAGLPCILSDRVAVAQEMSDAGFAVIVKPTAEAIGAAVGQISALRQKNADFAREAADYVRKTYATDTISAQMIDLYRDAAALGATSAERR